MTHEQLEAIRKRFKGTTSNGWLPTDGIFVEDENGKIVAECNEEKTAQFLGNAQWDVERLLAEVDSLREIVIGIGMNESRYVRKELEEDYFEVRDKHEKVCMEYASTYMKEHGLSFCDDCHVEFYQQASILTNICTSCVNKHEMESHGWDEYDGGDA